MSVYSTYVKNPASALLPILRSELMGQLLAELFTQPGTELSLADLQRRTGGHAASVHREVLRLIEAGLLLDRYIGHTRLVKTNTAARLYAPLRELVQATYGVQPVLEELLDGAPDVLQAFIFGSWSARHAGEPGSEPHDIDLLLVGSIRQRAAAQIAVQASDKLGIEVNTTVVRPEAWEGGEDPFIRHVQQRPLVELLVNHKNLKT